MPLWSARPPGVFSPLATTVVAPPAMGMRLIVPWSWSTQYTPSASWVIPAVKPIDDVRTVGVPPPSGATAMGPLVYPPEISEK